MSRDQAVSLSIKYQSSTELLIRRERFRLLVKEILQDCNPDMDINARAMEALHEASEAMIVERFQQMQAAMESHKR